MSRRVAGVVALLLVAAPACGSSHHAASNTTFSKTTARYRTLAAAAKLAPCPTTSATAAARPNGLPSLRFECLGDGPAVNLAGLSGTPTVVNIWGSWCIPCQAESTYLARAYNADRGTVAFLGVDTEDDWDSALSFDAHVAPPIGYPSVYDEDHKTMTALHQVGPPLTAFVSATGEVVHIDRGQLTSTAELQKDIATYLHVTT